MKTQQVLNKKHLGWRALKSTAGIAAGHLLRGQTNFVKMLWKFNSVYNPELQMADHRRPVTYEMAMPPEKSIPMLAAPRPIWMMPMILDSRSAI